jgi:hypothetical protein
VSRARVLVWGLAVVLVIAIARQIAYALAGAAVAQRLAGEGGGTDPIWIAAVALTAAALVAAAGTWLVAIGVRERCRLELERWVAPEPLRAGRIAWRAVALGLVTNLGFALAESCIHYEEGLGWMGLRCIEGPVHADAAPILIGLSLVVAALVTAAEHVLAALRRAVALLVLARRGVPRTVERRRPAPVQATVAGWCARGANLTRGPPLAVRAV